MTLEEYICVAARYPLPKHYSLTMEIAKDRTTKATVETCTSEKFDKDQCPRHVTVGQQFILRSLNEPCHKMVSRLHRQIHYKHQWRI